MIPAATIATCTATQRRSAPDLGEARAPGRPASSMIAFSVDGVCLPPPSRIAVPRRRWAKVLEPSTDGSGRDRGDRRSAAGAAERAAGEHQAGAAEHERRQPGDRRLERHRGCRGHPRHAEAARAATRAPSRGLAPLGPGSDARELAGAEGAEQGQRRERVPGRGDRAPQERGDAQLVAGGQQQPQGQRPRRRERAARQQAGPQPPYDQRRRPRARAATPSATSSSAAAAPSPANTTNAVSPSAPTSRSRPTLSTESALVSPARHRPVTRQTSAPTWPGVSRPEQLGLGVRAHEPAPRRARLGDRLPAQRAEEVLADAPRAAGRAAAATASPTGAGGASRAGTTTLTTTPTTSTARECTDRAQAFVDAHGRVRGSRFGGCRHPDRRGERRLQGRATQPYGPSRPRIADRFPVGHPDPSHGLVQFVERRRRVAPQVDRTGLRAADRPPHPLGRAGQVDVAHAEVAHGVDDGVLHGRRGPDGRRLADALGARAG